MIRGVIGEKLGHSYSKLIHEQLADYTYDLIELTKEQLDQFMKEKQFAALNVTIPYKQTVIPYLDELDEKARMIGAVNTIVNDQGKLKGYNTDYYGFHYMLKGNHISVTNKKVILLGNGGAAQAIKAVLNDLQVRELVIVGRKEKPGTITYDMCYQMHADAEVIINATPVGMFPNNEESPIQLEKFTQLESVCDIVYNPLRTKLIVDAQNRGCKTACGLMMLVAQAKQAVEIFLNQSIDDHWIEKITNQLLKEKENIVLIGMPSCGKTTISQLLPCDYTVVDIDQKIEEEIQMPIRTLFEQQGEEAFRKLETNKVKELATKTHQLISTGGGVIKRKENIDWLRQNGRIVYLDRDVDKLVADPSRPLSKDKTAIEKMYQERKPLYEAYSEVKIDNNGTVEETIEQILAWINKGE
ncbi:MAG: shikimate kinase [Erysipelotrichaceae bacterium]|nr:shikimate kinase [Erysipelotrichaceae bacterium]